MLRTRLAVAAGRIAGRLSRLVGRGGTAVPGLVASYIQPRLIERLAGSIPGGCVVVTGTNGKTTTTKMIVTMLAGAGRRVLTNRSGSNLERGLATTLLEASRRGSVPFDVAVFEVDEAAVADLGPRLSPQLVVVTNLARDQLDRYGELDTTARHVATAVAASDLAVLNGDDPMVAELARTGDALFGAVPGLRAAMPSDAELYAQGRREPERALDATVLAVSGGAEEQVVEIAVGEVEVEAHLQVPGLYNGYNAAAALLAISRLGLDPLDAATDLAAMPAPFGRGQVIEYRDRRVRIVLVKNPAGLNQVIQLLAADPGPASVLVAINDEIADGRDVSWLWDARVELLASTAHRYGAGGVRAADMALRFKYAGVEAWAESGRRASLDRLVEQAEPGESVYLIPTYTAMLEFLDLLRPEVARREAWS